MVVVVTRVAAEYAGALVAVPSMAAAGVARVAPSLISWLMG